MTRTSRTIGRTVFHASVSRSPKCERTQSAMNWLGMTMSSVPRVGLERAELGRLQPAVERARAQGRGEVRCELIPRPPRAAPRPAPRLARQTTFVPPPCTGPRLPIPAPSRDKRSPSRADPSRGATAFFSLAPGADSRPERPFCEPKRPALQVPFFHESEIMALDKGNTPKVAKNGGKPPFLWLAFALTRRANRGNCCIFLTVPKWNRPPVSRRPVRSARFSAGIQPSDATLLDSRENFRAAVFLWMTPRATPRAHLRLGLLERLGGVGLLARRQSPTRRP